MRNDNAPKARNRNNKLFCDECEKFIGERYRGAVKVCSTWERKFC